MVHRKKEEIIHGHPGSPGIVFGPLHVAARGFSAPEIYTVTKGQVKEEQARFEKALELTKVQLDELSTQVENISGVEDGMIFDSHLMVLEDKTLLKKVNTAIEERSQNAEYAFFVVIQSFLEAMRRVKDPYLRERASDVDDLCQRVLRNFPGNKEISHAESSPEHHHILIAYDLSPSDTVTLDRQQVLGFATEQGSINSHTAILARSLGIPAIFGLKKSIVDIESMTLSILDGSSGKLILNPTPKSLKHYQDRSALRSKMLKSLEILREKETATKDGQHITLSANIEFTSELPLVKKSGAEGIGLFRTEFYLLGGEEISSEEAQTKAYTQAAKESHPHQVIIRTLDAGGDKLSSENLYHDEANPFLGWRGIRVSLSRKKTFSIQLRAILRASHHGKTAILLPMVSGVREVLVAKEMIKKCMGELDKENIPYDQKIQIGVMIEVPSAAMMAREIAKEVDFLSIGTNDLIQYTVAVDRANPYVSHLYKPSHPAVIRLIDIIAKAAKEEGIWVGVCGEMAADLLYTPLLIGLGIEEFSVSTNILPSVKKAIRSLSKTECQKMAEKALRANSSPKILSLTQKLAEKHYPDLFE